jgi:hypothetical protein
MLLKDYKEWKDKMLPGTADSEINLIQSTQNELDETSTI